MERRENCRALPNLLVRLAYREAALRQLALIFVLSSGLAMQAVALSSTAQARTYVCEVQHAYDLQNGALATDPNEAGFILTWPTFVFDDETGIFKYGREKNEHWVEERMVVTSQGSKGMSASGYYMHNGTILVAVTIKAWQSPPSFLWLDVLTVFSGTCRILGN